MGQEYIDISDTSQYFYTSSYTLGAGTHRLLNFRSIKHLYYSNFNTGSGLIDTTGSYDNYLETSLFSGSRKLNHSGSGIIYSIPQKLFGTHLEPGSITISSSYSGDDNKNGGFVLTDDGEGNLFDTSTHVGNVIYSHGQLVITSWDYYLHLKASEAVDNRPTIGFKSNLPIYTRTYSIKIADYEFNHTLNPTAQTGTSTLYVDEYGKEVASNHLSASIFVRPSGKYAPNVTGSEFQPYITTVGLYNDSNELIAVAKLAQPLPKPADTELTIQVKLDV